MKTYFTGRDGYIDTLHLMTNFKKDMTQQEFDDNKFLIHAHFKRVGDITDLTINIGTYDELQPLYNEHGGILTAHMDDFIKGFESVFKVTL